MAGGCRRPGWSRCLAVAVSAAFATSLTLVAVAQTATASPVAPVAPFVPIVPFVPVVSGYVWASQPATPLYVADTGYEHNSTGHEITVTRSGTGHYQVRFEHMAVPGGVAHVTPYGSGPGFCTVASWRASAPDLLVTVRCFDDEGDPADMRFVAHFTNRKPGGTFAYFWSNQASTPGFYEPSASYRHDSTGAAPLVQRVAVGEYFAYVGAVDAIYPGYADGRFQITAYGAAPAHCEQGTVNDELPAPITVRCYDADGDPADSRFTFSYSLGVNLLGTAAPHATAWIGTDDDDDWVALDWSSPGAQPSVSRSSTGVYSVTFGGFSGPRGYATAGADTNQAQYCHVTAWLAFGAGETVLVRCFDGATHAPADLWFTLAFLP